MRIAVNVAGGTLNCAGTLFHSLETMSNNWYGALSAPLGCWALLMPMMAHRDPVTVTWNTVVTSLPTIGTMTFAGTSTGGYQSGAGRSAVTPPHTHVVALSTPERSLLSPACATLILSMRPT
jgi:hypothetical protein